MTKEELLQKGISEQDADKIIAALESDSETENNPVDLLQKALDGSPEMDDLTKADKEEGKDDEDEEKDDYNGKYMKKHMKRYMKENSKSCQKIMKEFGSSGEKMQKAIEEFDVESEGAVIEMTDLTPFLKEQSEFNLSMVKAVEELAQSVDSITAKTEKNLDIMQKAARVQVEQAKSINDFLAVPQGRKGVIANEKMAKASKESFSTTDKQLIYSSLMKAVKSRTPHAGEVISRFESSGQNLNLLSNQDKQYIQGLISEEAK